MALLDFVIWLPAVVAVFILLFARRDETARVLGLAGSLVVLLLSVALIAGFASSDAVYQFTVDRAWIPSLGARYVLGVDGISLFLLALTAVLVPVSLLASWRSVTDRVPLFNALILLLETGVLGVFAARDLLLFYGFWEASLIPMYFLIGIWGSANRYYATMKFVLYTLFGSLLMLVAVLWLYGQNAALGHRPTFDIGALTANLQEAHLPLATQTWLFLAFALAFAIKVPVFPFHTWLPDAHTEAPTAGSVILAGVLLKMGTYGFVRLAVPLFPDAALAAAPWICVLAVIGIVYGAIVAAVQPDMKRLVAYSSVAHMGFVMLGIFAMNSTGWQGAMLVMVNHGITTGVLFLLVGLVYDQTHTRRISDYGGIARLVPSFYVVFMITSLASAGLPGLNGFPGEFLSLLGSFAARPWMTAVAGTGVILAAVYLLWMMQRVFFGNVTNEGNAMLRDLTARQWAYLAPMVALMIYLGLFPNVILGRSQASVDQTLKGIAAQGVILTGKAVGR
jgi:NADH-quinone oxidoreductase subunit M